ncbi:hypothetical protein FGO68_gene12582 [Halteria grandinella]|uniref:Uncharacterized protein n=1 Tax=Halteria grandinella TaxID=5974 RepID=A0A8J8NZE5_HALGN|nr:hypothetical protein FGO68_gene12582 [Halteria grandinella]
MGNTCESDRSYYGCSDETAPIDSQCDEIFQETKFKVSSMKGLSLQHTRNPEVTQKKRIPKLLLTGNSFTATDFDTLGLNTLSLATTASRSQKSINFSRLYTDQEIEATITLQRYARAYISKVRAYNCRQQRVRYESNAQYFTRSEQFETLRNNAKFNSRQTRIGPRIYKYKSGAKYRGSWLGGFRDGKGEIFWSDGASYSGDWSLGHAHGKGQFVDKIGNIYEGPFYMSMAHGEKGVFTNTMGDVYTGQWKFDRKHGQGIEIWSSGQSKYEGTYADGEREGFGTFSVKGEVIYQGEWHRNQMHGTGKYRLPNGGIYEGEFYRGRIEGFGLMRYHDSDRVYEGEFKDGIREGYGIYKWRPSRPDSNSNFNSQVYYQGWWSQDKQHGLGVYINEKGELSYGLWQMGRRLQWFTDESVFLIYQENLDYCQYFSPLKGKDAVSETDSKEVFVKKMREVESKRNKRLRKLTPTQLFEQHESVSFKCPTHILRSYMLKHIISL